MRISRHILASFVACSTACLIVSSAFAQLPVPQAAAAAIPTPQPNPYASLYASATADAPAPSPNSELDRAEHLRLAIEHLTAAGLHELAGQLDRELLIEAKLEQIRKLQAEVDALRGVAKAPQILLQLKIVELQRSEMRKRGFDFSAKPNALADAGGTMLITKQELDKLVESLQKDKLAKVLAEPTLVTVSGRPACFQSGGEIPIIVPQSSGTMTTEYRQTGTRVDCVGTVMENGQVRLELSSTVSEVDASQSILLNDISVPGLRTAKVDTAVEIAPGQTVLLCGMGQELVRVDTKSDEAIETSLLVAVTVNVVGPDATTAVREQPRR